jgi:predicted nucleotidyltransferase
MHKGERVRLNTQEINTIRQSVQERDPNAVVYLFGSRVDDTARGGDIDLLVKSNVIDQKKKRDLRDILFHRLGDQKVDLFVTMNYSEPFARIAKRKGVRL